MRGHVGAVYEAHLECYMGKDPKHRPIIYLMRTSGYEAPGELADMDSQYTRLESSKMRTIDPISPLEIGPRGRHAYIWVDDYKTTLDTRAGTHVFFRIHNLSGMRCEFLPKSEYDFRLEAFVAERFERMAAEKEWFRIYFSVDSSDEADYLVLLGLKGDRHPWSAMMARPDGLQSSNTSWTTSVRDRFDLAKIWRAAGSDYKPRPSDGVVSELEMGNGKRLKVRILNDGDGLPVDEIPVVISIE
jgi:hypothetical protein